MEQSNPIRMTRAEASLYLREAYGIARTEGTLAKYAVTGDGPLFRKLGAKTVMYDREELDRWAGELLGVEYRSTSEVRAVSRVVV
jgi:hypothetical protein